MTYDSCIALVLAGGKGRRLKELTKETPKPLVTFGGAHRLIDFTLSNCANSRINRVGILGQYLEAELHSYLRQASYGELRVDGGIKLLPARAAPRPYEGTADAVYRNADYIDSQKAEYVLVLSADQVYKMDYGKMLEEHIQNGAAATIATTRVPRADTCRYGIVRRNARDRVIGLEDKPREANGNAASMGVYIFTWDTLRHYLAIDSLDRYSRHDFDSTIIPMMLGNEEKVYSHAFEGYWRDAGSIDSLWHASMELVHSPELLDLRDDGWRIYGTGAAVRYMDYAPIAKQSIVGRGSVILGNVERSVLSDDVIVDRGATVHDAVIMSKVHIGRGAVVRNCIIGPNAVIGDGMIVGSDRGAYITDSMECARDVALVAPGDYVSRKRRHAEEAQEDYALDALGSA